MTAAMRQRQLRRSGAAFGNARLAAWKSRRPVLESHRIQLSHPAPSGKYWMPAGVLDHYCDEEEATAVGEALGELKSYAAGEKPGRFGRAAWLRELFQWAEEQVTPLGLWLTGNFRQLNTSPTFSLISPGNQQRRADFYTKGHGRSRSKEINISENSTIDM